MQDFLANASKALKDTDLQEALSTVPEGFQNKRQKAIDRLPEFDVLRDQARDIKAHTIANLDIYLERFEASAQAVGSHVHWAKDAAEARKIIADICVAENARKVIKSKSMVTEEIALNPALESQGLKVIETDLGEYIIQLRREAPSHIIAPAAHLRKRHVEAAFRTHHHWLPPERSLKEDHEILSEARAILRNHYLTADVGITGANFCVAETGGIILVTNEGNADLTHTLPPCHITVTGLEKLVPTVADAMILLRVLARSATGQDSTCYTTHVCGPARKQDCDGPMRHHIVLIDNGRSTLLTKETSETLHCIRCGACMNHCPVYGAVGGHAYGGVYSGPIGAALNPGVLGLSETRMLPHASSFCGRCEAVCPVRIPLPKILRHWRARDFSGKTMPFRQRFALRCHGWFARHPRLYRPLIGIAFGMLRVLSGNKGWSPGAPFATNWTSSRDLPTPQHHIYDYKWSGGFVTSWKKSQSETPYK